MSNLKLEVMLDMVDKMSAPLNAMTRSTKVYSTALKEAKASLNAIEKAQNLSNNIKKDEAALKSLGTALGAATAKEKELAAATSALGVPTKAQAKAFDDATAAAKKLDTQYNTLKSQIETNKVKLEQGAAATRNLANADKTLSEMQLKAKAAVEQHTGALKTHQTAVAATAEREERLNRTLAVRDKLKGSGMSNMVGGAMMVAPMAAAVKIHAQFETAMLGVARQVEGARDANGKYTSTYYEMADGIQSMSERLPMAANEIADLAAAAARSGIVGKENILLMAETAAKASMAFDLPVAQLGDDLSKIAMLYKIPIPQIKNLGDTINYLDDQTLAKGGEIIDVMKRMGGFAEKMGASNAAAYASTLLTLGESNETAGTSMKAMVTKLGAAEKGTKHFQAAMVELGLSTKDVQQGMATDANATIQKVMEAVAKMPKDQQIGILKELFGLEHVGAASKLANNLGELRHQIELTQAAQADGSMDKEVQARLATTAAKWELLKNKAVNGMEKIGAAVTPYLVPLMEKIGNIISKIADWTAAHPQLTASIGAMVLGMGALRVGIGAAQLALGAFLGPVARVAQALKWLKVGNGTISGFARIGGILSKAGGWAKKFGGALKFMGKLGVKAFSSMARGAMMAGRMMLANPIILIIALIAGAAYLIYKNWDKIAPFIKKVWDKASKAVSDAWTKIKNYVSNGAQAILNYIKNLAIVKWLKEKWDAATAMMRGAVKTFTTVGGDIVAGLWNGLKAKFGAVLDWVREKTAAIATAAKSALGINSPSRVFMSIGHDTMAGLHAGLDKNHGKVLGNVRKLAQSMGGVPMRLQAAGMQAGAPAMNPTASFKPARAAAGNAGGFSFTFSGDIVIHADKDTNTASIAATVRREIEAVAREAASRARGSFMDRD